MTIDEAIKHCLEVAEQNETQAEKWREEGGEEWGKTTACRECAADHRQLAEWLMELKDLRAEQNDQYTFIRELMDELKEAKRLLKAAVEDIHELLCDKKNLDENGQSCNICSYIEWCPCCKECTIREDLRNWRYEEAALKLIGDEPNGI